jgi:hypothetical protein
MFFAWAAESINPLAAATQTRRPDRRAILANNDGRFMEVPQFSESDSPGNAMEKNDFCAQPPQLRALIAESRLQHQESLTLE